MKTTLTLAKADVGSIGGHIKPGARLMNAVTNFVGREGTGLIRDFYVSHTGDDIAVLLSHVRGVNDTRIHKLVWDAFWAAAEDARRQGLYGAGQDLLKDAFSGNIRGLGPAVCEMEFAERPNESFLMFAADKTDPGAYNLPIYLALTDPMFNAGLMLSPTMFKGFRFTIMDVSHTKGDRVIELNAPEELYDIAALLRDNQRYVVESVNSRAGGEPCVVVSTTRLHNIAGKYTGKDDPVMMVRVQGAFPATGEVLQPFKIGHFVAGFMRGSHTGPLMPVKANSTISWFDGPPIVSCTAFCVHEGKLSEPADAFDHPLWDHVRDKVSRKAIDIREQGFSGCAMLPYDELEYGGIVEKMAALDKKFRIRPVGMGAGGGPAGSPGGGAGVVGKSAGVRPGGPRVEAKPAPGRPAGAKPHVAKPRPVKRGRAKAGGSKPRSAVRRGGRKAAGRTRAARPARGRSGAVRGSRSAGRRRAR